MWTALITILGFLLLKLDAAEACKYLRSIHVNEVNSMQRVISSNNIPSVSMADEPQGVSVNLSQLFQIELAIPEQDVASTSIYFTDATESRPFVIQTMDNVWRKLKSEIPIDREEICDPFKFSHRAAVARKCCSSSNAFSTNENNQHNFKCCIFLDITVGNYGTFALRVDVVDVNDNEPQFTPTPESIFNQPGKGEVTVLKIEENTAHGTIIQLPSAVDFDEGKNAALLYQIDKTSPSIQWHQHFKLLSNPEDRCLQKEFGDVNKDVSLPALCLLKTIDRETVPGFLFNLIARDQGDPISLSSTLSMSIMILDENDNVPTFEQNEFKLKVQENEIGKVLLRLRVNDSDAGENARVSYFLKPGTHFESSHNPTINFLQMHILASSTNDGVVIQLIQSLDYEMVKSFDFLVIAQDHGVPKLASTATVAIQVENINDQPPVIRFFNKGNLLNSDYASLERDEELEKTTPLPSVICHVHVYDLDTNLDEIQCDINPGNRQFDLREVSTENTVQRRKIFELINLINLDREKAQSHIIRVRCTDGRTPTRLIGQSQIRIILKDVNDNVPTFQKLHYYGIVAENEANAEVDFRESFSNFGASPIRLGSTSHIHAIDSDAGQNAAIAYTLAAWNDAPTTKKKQNNITEKMNNDFESFYIDRVTGQVKTKVPLDFETKSTYNLLVIATDQPIDTSKALTSSSKVTITVKDLDDSPPVMLKRHYNFSVLEGIPGHSVVGKVEATDADSLPENRLIYYELRAASEEALRYFTVDRHSGLIRTIRPLDREQISMATLEVIANSGKQGLTRMHKSATISTSATTTVCVTILDKNDNAPYMVSSVTASNKDTPITKRILLAELVVPFEELQAKDTCVDFPFVFRDDDSGENGNVIVTLDENPHFIFNKDLSKICLKTAKPPPPGRYSFNILAQDNSTDATHRLAKRFPLRVLLESPIIDMHNQEKKAGYLEHVGRHLFREDGLQANVIDASAEREAPLVSSKQQTANRIHGTRKQTLPIVEGAGLPSDYRNVTIIAVLVCMTCILCIILLGILMFLRKCSPPKSVQNKRTFTNSRPEGQNNRMMHHLQTMSPSKEFARIRDKNTSDFDAERFSTVDMQPQMMVTIRPGSEKGYPTLSSNGPVMSSMVYSDDTNRMIPISPLLTQKNNFILASRSPENQRWAMSRDSRKMTMTPFYGPHNFQPVVKSPPPTNQSEISLIAQYHSNYKPAEQQTYGLLIQSKSYDELGVGTSPQIKQNTLKASQNEYNTVANLMNINLNSTRQTPTKIRPNNGYQQPMSQDESNITDEYTSMCQTLKTDDVVEPLSLANLSKSNPRTCGGQSSFV